MGSHCQHAQIANVQVENNVIAEFSRMMSWNSGAGGTFEGLNREKNADMSSSLCMDMRIRTEEATSYMPESCETVYSAQTECKPMNTGSFTEQVAGMATLQHHFVKLTGSPTENNVDMMPAKSLPCQLIQEESSSLSLQERLQPLASNASNEKFSAVFQTNPFPTTASGLLSQVIHAASCNPNFSADKYLNYSIDSGIQNSCKSGNSEQTLPSAEDGRPANHHDFELEQPHHYASLNSPITINTQTLDLMPAERTENLSEVGEGGECIIDTYNGNQRHVGETCEKTRLSKLRNKIRASRQSNLSEEWRRDLDLNKDPPEKNVKRKKHRPKVLQDSKPKRKSRGRKRKGQDMKETTTCNVHEILLDDEDATEKPQATLDSSSRLSMLKVVAGTSQHYECYGRESQHALICHESLDRDSALQVQISAVDIFRDQSIDNSLDSQNLSLSLSFSNENLLNRYLCARSFPMPGPEKKKSMSTTSRRSPGRRRGGKAIEAFDSTLQLEHWEIGQESAEAGNTVEPLQLEHWGIQQESAKPFSCLQTGREQDVYAWSADEIMKNQHWARGRRAGRKAGICNQSKSISLESKGSVASQVRDQRMVGEAVYHNFLECNGELQAISWLDSVSQGSHINNGELNDQDESSCKLLLGPPCCVYKPQSEASCVSTIINTPHPVEMETLLWNTECLQIVPYNQKREIVPSMPLRKGKKKPRAKVHLDEETNRVWLLLENGGVLPEETDYEKARIWEKERAMMKGRVDAFIKVMHSVQGDRRFSQWKGSIVDSIVGAFLTQNVSDHLSSSAFMSLASRFPARRTQKDVTDLQETRNMDPSLAAHCYDGSLSMLPKEVGLDLIECHAIDFESTVNGISRRDTTNAIDSFYPIDTPAEDGPMQFNIFTGSRTEASHRVRRRLQFEQDDVANERHYTCNLMSYSGVKIQPSISDHNYVDKGWPLGYVENEKGSGNGEMALAILESAQEKDSRLQTVEESKLENLSLEKGKKRLYQVSRITGIERAQLEISQGGYKKNRRDWDSLRRQVIGKACDEASNEASADATQQDAIDWEAIRLARIEAVADAIKERGMHNILSGRIKAFLTRLHEDHGSLDLEWIRKLSIEEARDYLLDIRGLGIKSVECIRLLTLHHLAFPVDTNVGRICVRLGWVPIEPLPEELQLHLLELYPVQETIQKYLWPRLCTLDQRTLYELHYQMITFGKVFCTKSKPNCNSCPLRKDCKHFASAFASSKLLLKSSSTESNMTEPLALPLIPAAKLDLNEPEASMICLGQSWISPSRQNQICEPIIEEPTTPEDDREQDIHDIEDIPYIYNGPSDYADYLQSDDIETICLNGTSSHLISFEEANEQERFVFESPCPDSSITSDMPFSQFQDFSSDITLEGLAYQSQSTGSDLTSEKDLIPSEGSLTDLALERDVNDSQCIIAHNASNAIVAVSLESAYIPVPKLKNIGRLRTVHYVYEIPDDHPLIREMDAREKDDPSFYLLAIWSPDEVPQSQEEIDQRCKENFCVSGTYGHDETVKGTLLIPCRTAMRGSFPLNGTYFQVNEVFADHESSVHPLEVPRSWIWNLRRRFVYFGTSVPNIFRGLSTEEIRSCFWLGHVCVRGFDRNSRAPKPLVARLHFPASKQIKAQRRSSSKVTT